MDILRKLLIFLLIIAFPLGEVARIPFNEIAVTLMDLMVGVVVLLWVLGKKKISKVRLAKPLLFFAGALGVSLLANALRLEPREIFISSLYLIRWVFYAALYFVIVDLEQIKPEINKSMLIGGVLIVFLGFLQYFLYSDLRNLYYAGWDEHLYRMFSSFLDPNFAGIFFVLFFLFLLERSKERSSIIKFLILATLAAVALTFSRSAYAAFIVGVFVYSISARRFKLGIGIISIFFVLVYIATSIVSRSEGTNLLRISSGEARVESLQNALIIIKDHPILGVGFNSYRYAQRDYGFVEESNIPIHSAAGTDNSFLFVLATAGIVGFAVFLYLWFKIISIKKPLIISSTIAVFVSSLFVNSLFFPPIMFWMWILIAVRESN